MGNTLRELCHVRVCNGSGQAAAEQNLSCDYGLTQHLGKKKVQEVSDTSRGGTSLRRPPARPPAPLQGMRLEFPRYCSTASTYRCSNPLVFLFFSFAAQLWLFNLKSVRHGFCGMLKPSAPAFGRKA